MGWRAGATGGVGGRQAGRVDRWPVADPVGGAGYLGGPSGVGGAPALAWFRAEHLILTDCVARAAETGFDTHAWQLAWTLWDAFDRQGLWLEWATTLRIALDAARRLDDPAATAHAHRSLGNAYTWLGQYQDAHRHLRAALDLYVQLGDDRSRARTHQNLAFHFGRQERYAEALDHAQQTTDLARASGDRAVEALGLEHLGWDHAYLGNYQQALAWHRLADAAGWRRCCGQLPLGDPPGRRRWLGLSYVGQSCLQPAQGATNLLGPAGPAVDAPATGSSCLPPILGGGRAFPPGRHV